MKPLEVFRLAIQEIGDVSATELTAHIENKFGVTNCPRIHPAVQSGLADFGKEG